MRKRDPSGCQSLERGLTVLHCLASAPGESGMRLVEVQQETGLTRGTVHRILGALSRHGLVEQEFGTRRYHIDREANFLSGGSIRRGDRLRALCHAPLREAARELGDTIILMARSGESTVCVDRYSGNASLQPLTVEVGTRRPLIAGAGGLAILASLRVADSLATLRDLAKRYPEYLHYVTVRTIQNAVHHARQEGYAFSDGYARPNVRAIGVAIRDTNGEAIGALTAASVFERLEMKRIEQIVAVLKATRAVIESQITSSAGVCEPTALWPHSETATYK
jgi:DNA-binding IclR family transcriptional regulator